MSDPGNSEILKIRDFMSSPVSCIDSESTAQEAAKQLIEKNVGSLLVTENGEYVGIITKTDLVKRVVANGKESSTKVGSIMSKPVLSIDHYLPTGDAQNFMHRHNIKHLAVTEQNKIVGILSPNDLV